MIAKLRGRLDSTGEDWAIIDVGGVGYLLTCSARCLRGLGAVATPVEILVETQMRDDRIQLFGFLDDAERSWFRLLQSVQGVGAKAALAVLSALEPAALVTALAAQDRAALTRAPGIGPKIAARILVELKDKAGAIALGAAGLRPNDGMAPAPAAEAAWSADAVSALVNLGYGRSEAFGAIVSVQRVLGKDADLAALIRAGLKELAS